MSTIREGLCERKDKTLTGALENNEMQIHAITERANAIKLRVVGQGSEACAGIPCPKDPFAPGLCNQAELNTQLLADLYGIILEIDARL